MELLKGIGYLLLAVLGVVVILAAIVAGGWLVIGVLCLIWGINSTVSGVVASGIKKSRE
jgi:hypothetical protein